MLLKKDTNKTDLDVLISFLDLSHCSFSYQLYKIFVMLKKLENSNNKKYLDNKIRMSKIMITLML